MLASCAKDRVATKLLTLVKLVVRRANRSFTIQAGCAGRGAALAEARAFFAGAGKAAGAAKAAIESTLGARASKKDAEAALCAAVLF